jgi:hypothetical protein
MNKAIFLSCLSFLSCSLKNEQSKKPETNDSQKHHQISTDDLQGTKWSCKIADACINTYQFKPDSLYIFYSCEMEDTYYGKYFVKNDTLHLDEYATATDSLLSTDSPERSEKAKFKVIMADNKLKHVVRLEEVNGVWKKSNFSFPENYLYVKEK